MPPPRIPDTSSHSSSEEGSQQAPTIGSDRVLDKDLDMVHDRNCKVRMLGRFLLRNILAVGDILWAYFILFEAVQGWLEMEAANCTQHVFSFVVKMGIDDPVHKATHR